ncbi:UvrB/UvrC motif-containing protein [Candidatus Njordibacter sp. Uisw_002]
MHKACKNLKFEQAGDYRDRCIYLKCS